MPLREHIAQKGRKNAVRTLRLRELVAAGFVVATLVLLLRGLAVAGMDVYLGSLLDKIARSGPAVETMLAVETGSFTERLPLTQWINTISEDIPHGAEDEHRVSIASPAPDSVFGSHNEPPEQNYDEGLHMLVSAGQTPAPSAAPPAAAPPPTPAPTQPPAPETSVKPVTQPSGLAILNTAKLDFSIDSLLGSPLGWKTGGKGVQVLIVHTHGTEAYTPDKNNNYSTDDPYRTENTKYNVVRIGDEMEKILSDMGIKTLHDRKIYDRPNFSGSYGRSLAAVKQALADNPSIKVVLDIHRDAIIDSAGNTLKAVATVDGKSVAQVMMVVGTNATGLDHPDWKKNLSFALKLQRQINKAYPSLLRQIDLREYRFNQHVTPGALIVEVGTSGNTLEEAVRGGRLYAEQLGKFLLDTAG